MENRFGVKDLFLFSLVILLIVAVFLAMTQYDRQYAVVRDLQRQGHDQLRELVAIHSALDRGVSFNNNATTQATSSTDDAFADLRAMRQQGKYNQGDWFVQNLRAEVAKLTPLLSTDVYAAWIENRVMETLVNRDPETLDYKPLLATSWKITDNLPAWQAYVDKRKVVPITEPEIMKETECPPVDKADERKTYISNRLKEGRREDDISAEADCPVAEIITFQLRHGVTFSDGSPFTADDVVFTYDFTMDPKVESPRDKQALERVKSVKKLGDFEVQFNLRDPYFLSFDLAGSLQIMSKVFYSKYTPEDFNKSVGLLIGTGPYRLESPSDWKPTTGSGKIELIRNERYWGLPTSFDRLVYDQIPSDATNMVMFTNGETDMITLQPSQYKELLQKPDVVSRSNNFEFDSPVSGYYYIAWNQSRDGKPTVFADKHIRQAMTLLTDREGICKSIYLGYAAPSAGPFSPGSKQNDPALKDWTYDPEAGKKLLKEAGFDDRDGSGVLKKADGTPLSFKLSYSNKNETYQRVMQYVKDGYARAGISCELDPVDWPVIEQRLKLRNFDVISLGWSSGIEGDLYQSFDSSQIQNEADNFISYNDPKMDTAIHAARRELDENKRMALWHQCQRILHDDQPYTFLITKKQLQFYDKRIQNVVPAKAGLNWVQDWNNPIPWYVPAGSQKYTN